MSTNKLSHRDQHRIAAASVGAGPDATSTGDDYRRMRHAVAAQRREEQRQSRIAAGTDRASRRALRGAPPVRQRGRIGFIESLLGRA